jgi:chemotaxis protein histidine kinase CheA
VAVSGDDPLEQQLRALRREYLADSVQRVAELREGRARLPEEPRTVLPQLRQAFHRLAGSGGSYGFPAVSRSSREGEQLVQGFLSAGTTPQPADLSAIDACIERIAAAFDEARRADAEGSTSA